MQPNNKNNQYETITLKLKRHHLLKMIKPKAIQTLIETILWQKRGVIGVVIDNAEIVKLKPNFELRLDEQGDLKIDDKTKFNK